MGVAGDTSSNWKDVFTDLLVVDSLRGAHSTGVAAVRRFKDEIELVKQPGGPHFLIPTVEYKRALSAPIKCVIGHNRYATVGEHTIENAHPFQFEKVVGAHNGTLEKGSIRKLHEHEKWGTDSEAIYANINEFGLRDTVDKLAGAWALTWFDATSNTINFLRNDKRPLYYCYSKDRCTLLWASEVEMLEFVLGRTGKPVLGDEYFTVESNVHYSWRIPASITTKFDAPAKEKMEAPPAPLPDYSHYHHWQPRGGSSNNVVPFHKRNSTGGKQSTGSGLFDFLKRDTSAFRPPYKGPKGSVIGKKDFYKIVSDGCVFCGLNSIDWGEFVQIFDDAEGKRVFLCEDCYNDEEIYDICRNLI